LLQGLDRQLVGEDKTPLLFSLVVNTTENFSGTTSSRNGGEGSIRASAFSAVYLCGGSEILEGAGKMF